MKNILRALLIFVLLFAAFRPSQAMGQFFFMENEAIGKPAQDFTLPTVGGTAMNFAQFRGKDKAIIFFWATWCPHCRRELGDLNQIQGQLSQKGIKVALVDIGEDENMVRQYLQKNGIQATVFLDEDSSAAESYGVVGVPTFYLVDSEGIVRGIEHTLPENYEEILAAEVGSQAVAQSAPQQGPSQSLWQKIGSFIRGLFSKSGQ